MEEFDERVRKFFEAVENNEIEHVKNELEKMEYLVCYKLWGQEEKTVFHVAIQNKRYEILELLCSSQCADLNARDCYDETVLHIACRNMDLSVIKLLTSDNILPFVNVGAFNIDGVVPTELLIKALTSKRVGMNQEERQEWNACMEKLVHRQRRRLIEMGRMKEEDILTFLSNGCFLVTPLET